MNQRILLSMLFAAWVLPGAPALAQAPPENTR
jgi:hypothetical protein